MIPCMCLVQEGQISDAQQASLRAEMTSYSQRNFGADPAIGWIVVPKGSGFTEAKPSNSVIVSMTSNRSLQQDVRVPMIQELCDIWMEGTDLTAHEVVAMVADPAPEGE